MSTRKSNPVRESMLQLMQNAGVAYEVDDHDDVYEGNDKDDNSLPSVPSSSNLSEYFHEELPPGYMLKSGEVAAAPHKTEHVSSPSSVLHGPATEDNNCTDGLRTVAEDSGEYSLEATSASSSTRENDLEGRKAEAPSSLMMPHLLAAKGTSGVSASKLSDTQKTPSSIRVNSKLSKEMYKDAIKAATRGSLRRLLDADNQQQVYSPPPPIFSVVPKQNFISKDIDASSDYGSEVASSITDTFAFSSVYGGEDEDNQNMEAKMHMSAIEEMTRKSNSDKEQTEASVNSYHPWVITPAQQAKSQKNVKIHQSDDQNSTYRAFDPSLHPVPPTTANSHSSTHSSIYGSYFTAMEDETTSAPSTATHGVVGKAGASAAMKYRDEKFEKDSELGMTDYEVKDTSVYSVEDEGTVDVEEGQSMADVSYGWSETRVTYDLSDKDKKETKAYAGKDLIDTKQAESDEPTLDIESGNLKQDQDDTSPIYTCVPEGGAAKKISDDFSDEYYAGKDAAEDERTYDYSDADGAGGGNNEQTISFKQKVLQYKTRQNKRRFMMVGAVGIVAILGAIVGVVMSGQNGGDNENNDPNRGGNSNPNEKFPTINTTTTTSTTIPPASSTTMTEPTTLSEVVTPESTTNATSPTISVTTSATTTTTEVPSTSPSTQPSTLPSTSPSTSTPTLAPSSTPSASPTTPQPTTSPSTSPTSSTAPSTSPTTIEELQRREDMTTAAIDISGVTTIEDPTTPQYKALEWMIRDDGLQLNATSPNFVQRYSMSTFYFSTSDGVWTECGADPFLSPCSDETQRFLSSNNECDWFGIGCNANGEVTEIRLKENGLSGTSLPKEIASFSSLDFVHLSKNAISATIPTEFGLLTSLEYLYLNDNNIVGTIPTSLGNLNKLFLFSVGNNEMNGTVPGEIFHPTLKHLDIDGNNFHGSLPDEMFTSSVDLINIDIRENEFDGTIPTGFGNLNSVRLLRMNNNNFVGSLPPEVFTSSSLRTFDCSSNNLNGSLPEELYGATSLQVLNLASNDFSGEISSKIGDLEDLMNLNLQSNKFEGAIPSALGSLNEIMSMDLSYNLFTGSMPSEVCTLRDGSLLFTDLVSDCDGSPAQVSCSCCSSCEVGYGI